MKFSVRLQNPVGNTVWKKRACGEPCIHGIAAKNWDSMSSCWWAGRFMGSSASSCLASWLNDIQGSMTEKEEQRETKRLLWQLIQMGVQRHCQRLSGAASVSTAINGGNTWQAIVLCLMWPLLMHQTLQSRLNYCVRMPSLLYYDLVTTCYDLLSRVVTYLAKWDRSIFASKLAQDLGRL